MNNHPSEINPFVLEALSPDSPFCDRREEYAQLLRDARDHTNVVLHSPRRYGKTSLVLKVQDALRKQGYLTVYAHLFGVDSVSDLGNRIATAFFRAVHAKESLLDKGRRLLKGLAEFRPVVHVRPDGYDLTVEPTQAAPMQRLESVLLEIGEFAGKGPYPVHVVLDEIQEVCRLKESAAIEGVIRGAVQGQPCSYVFPGSRRGILLAMFNNRKRAFFQSARMMELPPLPHGDAVLFLQEQFQAHGKTCDAQTAAALARKVDHYPYYIQSLAREVFDLAGQTITLQHIEQGLRKVRTAERYAYEAVCNGLTPHQLRFLKMLAHSPLEKPFSADALRTAAMSQAVVQNTIRKLGEEDLIERSCGAWRIVDPVFALWLRDI